MTKCNCRHIWKWFETSNWNKKKLIFLCRNIMGNRTCKFRFLVGPTCPPRRPAPPTSREASSEEKKSDVKARHCFPNVPQKSQNFSPISCKLKKFFRQLRTGHFFSGMLLWVESVYFYGVLPTGKYCKRTFPVLGDGICFDPQKQIACNKRNATFKMQYTFLALWLSL